jgi:NitT/TauT family transport system substrate-binding protein
LSAPGITRGGALFALTLAVTVTPARAQQAPAIRIVTTQIDSGAEVFYADSIGLFKKAGITVEITRAATGAAIAAAVASGAADIGHSNVLSIATAHDRGVPLVIIAPSNLFVARLHQTALVIAINSPIQNARDLAGKTIAVNGLKSITEIATDAWLEQQGVSLASVKFVDMPFSTMPDAVAHGRVDAAITAEPEMDDGLAKKQWRVLSYPYEAVQKQFMSTCWFTSVAWARAHPDLVRAYANAMQQTADWANKNQAQSGKILEQLTGMAIPPGNGRVFFARELDLKDIQPVIDVAAKYGALKAPFPAADLVFRAN